MRDGRPSLTVAAIGMVLAVVLTLVFAVGAVELASAQSSQRHEIQTEIRDRAVLSASLIDSLFQTVESNQGTYRAEYGSSIDRAALDAAAGSNGGYAVVTDSSGRIIAASAGFTGSTIGLTPAQLRAIAAGSAPYYLGNLVPYGTGSVADIAVPFPAGAGKRILVTSASPATLAQFFDSELAGIPGVRGEANYLVDGNGRILGSSDSHRRAGTLLSGPGAGSEAATGDHGASYVASTGLDHSTWRVILVAPSSALFASVSGARQVVPWVIFALLVVSALVTLLLGAKVLRSASAVRDVNARLAVVNEELHQANRSLERRAAELARSNQELDSFASIASHDLQEPLRKVRTFNEQLTVLEADRLSAKGRDYLARSNAAAERMQRLIEDLLQFSRVTTQGRPFELVDLDTVLAEVLGDLDQQITDAGAHVHADHLPTIVADRLQMQQLLQNLVSNAVKFRREGVPPEVGIRARVDGGELHLEVSDNGIGFEPRYASRIFRIFERLNGRTAYTGTGIGLALCRKIADRHGGSIEAIGHPGEGATFVVTLPVDQPEGSYGFGVDLERVTEQPAHV